MNNNTEKILQDIDDLMVEKTESRLTPVQEAILIGVLQGHKYWQIAQSFNGCSESHIKKEAAKLWKKLGQVLDEDINKDNLRSRLERKYRVSQSCHSGSCLLQIDNINIGGQIIQTTSEQQKRLLSDKTDNKFPIIDLAKAPELKCNYGRNLELSTLKEWINNKTRLITIYGLRGIGKTALTLKLIEEIQTEFDYIIYRSLENSPQLIDLKDDLKQFFDQSQPILLPDIIDYLRSSRCLIILDDLQNIFKTGELAGQYLTEYENYGQFFKQIVNTSHQSCLILLSWEQPREFVTLRSDKVQTLYLKGLESQAEEILQEYCLKNQERWPELITLYQGHPSWLNIIASTIIEPFEGKVSLFLEQMQNEIYLGEIELLLASHLQRLSTTENKIIHWLSRQSEAVEITLKPTNLDLSYREFLATIQSLIRRCLVDKIQLENQVYFQLNPLIKTYI